MGGGQLGLCELVRGGREKGKKGREVQTPCYTPETASFLSGLLSRSRTVENGRVGVWCLTPAFPFSTV